MSEGDDDTRERKRRKREAVTKRTREGGSKGDKAATAPDDADTDD